MGSFIVSAAASAAFSAAAAFLRPSQNIERGRIQEIPIQSSEFGNMIPRIWGTVRTGGNVIWSSGLREESETQSAKGIGGPSVTTFTYFTDAAVMLCENRIIDVLRIWADGKIIYDKTGTLATPPQANQLTFRLYRGTEDQEPDPLITLDVDGRLGTGSTPAYRGRAYIVFENLNLTNYGNRLPNFSFEVVADPVDGSEVSQLSVVASTTTTPFVTETERLTCNSSQGRLYVFDSTASGYELSIVDMDTMAIINNIDSQGGAVRLLPTASRAGLIERTNRLFGQGTTISGFESRFHTVDANTFAVISEVELTRLRVGAGGAAASFFDDTTAFDVLVFLNDNLVASRGIYLTRGNGARFVDGLGTDLGDLAFGETIGAGFHIRTPVVSTGPNGRHAYAIIGADTPPDYDSLFLFGVGINSDDPNFDTFTDLRDNAVPTLPVSVQYGTLATLTPATFGLTEFGPADNVKNIYLAYDRISQSIIVFAEDDAGNAKALKWTRTGGVVKVIDVPSMPGAGAYGNPVFNGEIVWASIPPAGNNFAVICRINVAEFEIDPVLDGVSPQATLNVADWAITSFAGAPDGIYDSTRRSIYAMDGNIPYRISTDAGDSLSVTLANIVEDVSIEAGVEPIDDMDVSELRSTLVPGFLLSNQQSARNAIQPLADYYFFDGIESDYKIRYPVRGRSSSATITEDSMVRRDEERVYVETRVPETEIPTSVQVTFLDSGNSYQRSAEQSARVLFPARTVAGDNQQTIDVLVSETADSAAQVAERTLFTRWNERDGFEFRAGWQNILIDPADVTTLTLNNGRSVNIRNERADIGADLSLEFSGVVEEVDQYVSTKTGQSGISIQTLPTGARPAELFLLDVPLLRDIDDPGQAVPRYYFAGSVIEQISFGGAVLWESVSAGNFQNVSSTSRAASYGNLLTSIPAVGSPWTWDNDTTIDIVVARGAANFVTASDLDVLNGANALGVLRENGEVEVIQFANVTVTGDSSVRLQRILRGRRGTEVFAQTEHAIGARVVLLRPADLNVYNDAVAEINVPHQYRLVAVGRTLEDTTSTLQTPVARSLTPYAVGQQKAVLSASDIILTAVRRTRINGELIDGTGEVPLNEESELYDIEIFDGATVVRTVSNITTPSYTYTNAEIINDFGSIPTELTLKWYQRSAVVGRGFSLQVTIPVT